jgi:hypothetical protein
MEIAILTAVISAIAAVLGPIIAALLSRKREKTQLDAGKTPSQLEASQHLPHVPPLGKDKPEEFKIIWGQFLAEANDDNLEHYLYKVELLISKYPNEIDGPVLKTLILKALVAKSKRRLVGPPPRHPLHMLATRFYLKPLLFIRKAHSVIDLTVSKLYILENIPNNYKYVTISSTNI